MGLHLVVSKGKHRGMVIDIKQDLFMFGSDQVCQLRSQQPGIAPQHCALLKRERKIFVRDLDGSQPTVINDAAMPAGSEWPLHSGDRLGVGPLEFVVEFREKALSQRDGEEWALKVLDKSSTEAQKKQESEELYKDGGNQYEGAANAAAAILKHLESKKGEVKGRLRVFSEAGVNVVRINDRHLVEEGEISLIQKELTDHLAKTTGRVLLDLKNVHRMSSMALSMIVHLHRQLKARGATLALCQVNPDVLPVLQAVGMGKLFPCFPNKDAALGAKW
ncbi:MAG: STAS domain-containing protein [Planctomycetes bacterium]|nr:STAS domain-containing protein [Planctomycetota bacterium]